MTMGLADLVKDSKDRVRADRNKGIEPSFKGIQVSYDREEKPCPSCRCLSPMVEGHREYECPNPTCGVIYFHAGWNEMRISGPFSSLEIEGWRYEP